MRSIRNLALDVLRMRQLRADAVMLVSNRQVTATMPLPSSVQPAASVINVEPAVINVQPTAVPITNQIAVPEVYNQVVVQPADVQLSSPAIVVQVDMFPVAQALDRLANLVSLLPNPVSRTTVQVPDGAIQVNMPATVQPPIELVLPPHEKRSFTIKHDDGTTSVVTEQ